MGSAGGLGALRAPLAGFGAEPQPKSNLLPFSPKISHQVPTISIIFNAMQTTNFKVKNIWGGNASPAYPLNPPMFATTEMSVIHSVVLTIPLLYRVTNCPGMVGLASQAEANPGQLRNRKHSADNGK